MGSVRRLLRLTPGTAAVLGLALAAPQPAAAWLDRQCGGTGQSGVMFNDNGLRSPFGDYCSMPPIVHVYRCSSGFPFTGTLRLGTRVDFCAAGAGTCDLCQITGVSWCNASPSPNSLAEDGVTNPSGVLNRGTCWVTLPITYQAQDVGKPWIRVRADSDEISFGVPQQASGVPLDIFSTSAQVNLRPGIHDLQVTLFDAADCIPDNPEGQEIYLGGETEDYRLTVGSGCETWLDPLFSLH